MGLFNRRWFLSAIGALPGLRVTKAAAKPAQYLVIGKDERGRPVSETVELGGKIVIQFSSISEIRPSRLTCKAIAYWGQ